MNRLLVSITLVALSFSRAAHSAVAEEKLPILPVGVQVMSAVRSDLMDHLQAWSAEGKLHLAPETLTLLRDRAERIGMVANPAATLPVSAGNVITVNEALFSRSDLTSVEAEALILKSVLQGAPATSELERLEDEFEQQLTNEGKWLNFRGKARMFGFGIRYFLDELKSTDTSAALAPIQAWSSSADFSKCMKKRRSAAAECDLALGEFGNIYDLYDTTFTARIDQLAALHQGLESFKVAFVASLPPAPVQVRDLTKDPLFRFYDETDRLLDARIEKTRDLSFMYLGLKTCFDSKKPWQVLGCLVSWTKKVPDELRRQLEADQVAVATDLSRFLAHLQETIRLEQLSKH